MTTPLRVGGYRWNRIKALALDHLKRMQDQVVMGCASPRTASERLPTIAMRAATVQEAVVELADIADVDMNMALRQLKEIAAEAVQGVCKPALASVHLEFIGTLAAAVRTAIVEMAVRAETERGDD